jgi:hypothetical protein
MEWTEHITLLMKSLCSLFYLGTSSHKVAVGKCADIASSLSMDVYRYNIGEGLWRLGQEKSNNADVDPIEMLNRIIRSRHEPLSGKRKLFLLEHFDVILENRDPFLLTRLRVICDQSGNRYTVILLGRPGFRLPEIIRAGRFDAVFFIDLPSRKEREHILRILFRKYGLDGKLQVTEELLSATNTFSGAELEQAIADLFYEQNEPGGRINEFVLLRTIKRMVPLARTMRENLEFMREWYRTRARLASSLDDADQKGERRVCHISQK